MRRRPPRPTRTDTLFAYTTLCRSGAAPDIAGQGIANPTSLILSAAMLLDWLGRRRADAALREAAARIEAAVEAILGDPAQRTRAVGGPLGPTAFAVALVGELA